MDFVLISEIFTRNDIKPFLLGVIYSRNVLTDDKEFFVLTSSFKKSDFVFDDDFDFNNYKKEYRDILSKESGYYWRTSEEIRITNYESIKKIRSDYKLIFKNDLKLTTTHSLYLMISQKILCSDWALNDKELNYGKRMFIRGFMETRGSIDTTRPLIAQDYFFNNSKEASRIIWLFSYNIIPAYVSNINFRNLQKDHFEGIKKRNTQFRINLYWYMKNIGLYNKYKVQIIKNKYSSFKNIKMIDNAIGFQVQTPSFEEENNNLIFVLNFYTSNVIGKKLSKDDVQRLRSKIGLSNLSNDKIEKERRSKKIIDIYKEISEDKCAICGTTKTYTEKATNRQHFEIHHVISVKSGKISDLDKIENLVKLCPTCHESLRKGSMSISEQIFVCKKIISSNDMVFNFCSAYFGTDDIDELSKLVQKNLK